MRKSKIEFERGRQPGDGAEREKETRKTREKRFARSSSTCFSNPLRQDETGVQEGPQNSVKKGAHVGLLNVGERAYEPAHSTLTRHSPCSRGASVKAA